MIEPTACPTGSYANNLGSDDCTECPQGFACPDPTQAPQGCPAGEYQNTRGKTSCQQVPPILYMFEFITPGYDIL